MRDVEGNAWMVSASTSMVTRARMASTHSWMAAEASGAAMAAPSSCRLARSTTMVTCPKVASTLYPRALVAKSADLLERVEALGDRSVQVQADEGQLRLRVGRPRQGPIVGRHVVAQRHPDGQLTLVVRLVRVQLRARHVPDQVHAIRDAQSAVVRQRGAVIGIDTHAVQPETFEGQCPADRQQRRMSLARWCRHRGSPTSAPSRPVPACPNARHAEPDDRCHRPGGRAGRPPRSGDGRSARAGRRTAPR